MTAVEQETSSLEAESEGRGEVGKMESRSHLETEGSTQALPGYLPWEDDLEMVSQYLDRKVGMGQIYYRIFSNLRRQPKQRANFHCSDFFGSEKVPRSLFVWTLSNWKRRRNRLSVTITKRNSKTCAIYICSSSKFSTPNLVPNREANYYFLAR